MKKSGVNSGWSITGKNSLDMNSTVCALHVKNMFLTSQLARYAVAANETQERFVTGICHNFYSFQLQKRGYTLGLNPG